MKYIIYECLCVVKWIKLLMNVFEKSLKKNITFLYMILE